MTKHDEEALRQHAQAILDILAGNGQEAEAEGGGTGNGPPDPPE